MSVQDQELLEAKEDQFGEGAMETIISAMEPLDGPPDTVSAGWDVQSNDGTIAESKLRRELSSGNIDRLWLELRPVDDCKQAFVREVDLPFYDNPQSLNDTVAWADVCATPRSWLQMSVRGFDNRPEESLLLGLSPTSVRRVREGLNEGPDVVPMGFVELDRNGRFTANQEGRNRGVAALLEGIEWMQGRVFLNMDER